MSGRKVYGYTTPTITSLTFRFTSYPSSVTNIMASVRNVNDPLPQATDNVVLFEMMMHYKRRLDIAEASLEQAKKRAKKQRDIYEDALGGLQHQLHEQIETNREFARANEQGARMIVRKHQAGMRLVGCLDDLFESIDIVNDTGLGDDKALGMEYISMHAAAIKSRAETALELFTWDREDPEDDDESMLAADEIIDLTGETTEEEEVEEV